MAGDRHASRPPRADPGGIRKEVLRIGEVANLWLFGLGCLGFAVGSIVVLTMPALVASRLLACAVVLLAAAFATILVIVGVVPPLLGLIGSVLMPVLTAIGLRYRWCRRSS